jgi:hypothetical protein
MKKFVSATLLISIILTMLTACAPATPNPDSADLSIMADSNSKLFLGDSYQSEGLLQQFYEEKGYKVYVNYVDGPEAEVVKNTSLGIPADKKTAETFDAFIFDDQLFGSGLKDVVFPARSFVGVWIRQDKATDLGLAASDPYLTHDTYSRLLEDGQIKIVNPPASRGTASALDFFATMAYCSGNPNAQLTVETVQSSKECGKRIYDHYARSARSTSEAVQSVFEDNLSGRNLFDGVVAFQSSFAGKKGLNQQLVDNGKNPFLFFYFSDATPIATTVMGNSGNLTEREKKVYDELALYIVTEEAQQLVADHAILPGSSAFGVLPDYSAFNPAWGLTIDPKSVPVNAPVYSVAMQALEEYRLYYKRAKEIYTCIDISGSMFNNEMTVRIDTKDGLKDIQVKRIQALNLAILKKITDPNWLVSQNVTPGPKDVVNYYFFADKVTGLVAQSVGSDTAQAGEKINSILGPWNEEDPTAPLDRDAVEKRFVNLFGFSPNGTAMFDCANKMLEAINRNYDPNVDYYIIIHTDGEWTSGAPAEGFTRNWNNFPGRTSVTVVGIAFGLGVDAEKNSINKAFTSQFGGNTFQGNDDADLAEAFKNIFSR